MKRLRVTILDLVTKGPTKRTYSRVMNANLASIMPQVVGVWAEELGHDVRFVCYTGLEDLESQLLDETDVLFIAAFTRSALTAYAISALYRNRGVVTVLGGPHARSYPRDAARYFDYVLGFTDKDLVDRVLRERSAGLELGMQLSAETQPTYLPGVKERWKFIEPTIAKAPALKLVPMIGSMGCPYTCKFCIDSVVDYQPLGFDQIAEDLRFLVDTMGHATVAWHDPNFGVRFNDYMTAIENAVPPGRIRHAAESSLALLSEPNLQRMQRNGFIGILPGLESWYEFGNKSKAKAVTGLERVEQVSEHVNTILRYIPFVQTNFVLGLDCDEGPEPFELTKRFVDLTPGAYPAYSLFTCYGQAAPMNLDLQREGRVLPFPFQFLDSIRAMNVIPANYGWLEFYELTIDLIRHTYTGPRVWRRLRANHGFTTKALNAVRALSSSRIKYQLKVAELIRTDATMQRFFAGESRELPEFYRSQVKEALGSLWELLPEGSLDHDENEYLTSYTAASEEAGAAALIEANEAVTVTVG
ncbi:MAG: radical SAM protein [Gammaproteobacteria bacterium]|nr:radical SAM protein [Gammaproteobacteria bacterium]